MQNSDHKRYQYRDLKPVIKQKFQDYLEEKKLKEGLTLPDELQGRYAFGAYMEPGEDDWFSFNLMITGERPQDAVLVLEAKVSRRDGEVKEWRCYDDAFVRKSEL
jgi:hypothetical protein